MQTNNVIAKMFDGIGRKNVSGVEGVNKSELKNIFSNLLNQESNFMGETKQSIGTANSVPTYEDSADSYNRYQYKKNQIESG